MAACGYELYLLVFNSISQEWAQRSYIQSNAKPRIPFYYMEESVLLETKLLVDSIRHIFSPPCNILYVFIKKDGIIYVPKAFERSRKISIANSPWQNALDISSYKFYESEWGWVIYSETVLVFTYREYRNFLSNALHGYKWFFPEIWRS